MSTKTEYFAEVQLNSGEWYQVCSPGTWAIADECVRNMKEHPAKNEKAYRIVRRETTETVLTEPPTPEPKVSDDKPF